MAISLQAPDIRELKPHITVFGVGGAGGNAIANMMRADVQGVEFLVANTDAQALLGSKSDVKIQIGKKLTRGLGAGARPEIGRQAVDETRDEVSRVVANTDLVFITCGMGGGTGTGAATTSSSAAGALRAQWGLGGGAVGIAVAGLGVVFGAGMVL